MVTPVSTLKRACWAISLPWSQVMDRWSCWGSVTILAARASATTSAWCPSGSPTSTTKRRWRSTSVATALIFLPKSRSPSQWPGDGTVVGLGGSLADVDRSSELALAVHHGVSERPASGVSPTQVAGQFPAQRAARLHEQRQVDRLVKHPHLRIVREGSSEPTGDLLRRPAQLELALHHGAEPFALRQLRSFRPTSSAERIAVRPAGAIAAHTAVRPHFPRDRRRRPTKPARDRPQRLTTRQAPRDFLAFAQRQPRRRPVRVALRRPLQPVDVSPDRPP